MHLPPTSATTATLPSHWSHTLLDGRAVEIRPLGPGDREGERAFISALSPESRHFRFLCALDSPSEPLLDRLTRLDATREAAFAAVVSDAGGESIVGVSRFAADADGRGCECAVAVADAWQRQGLGSLLMRHLIDAARERGLRRMYSVDAASNAAMHELAGHLGFHARTNPQDATEVIHELDL